MADAKRGDPQWATLLPVACLFLALGGALLWVVQRLSKRTLPWFLEGFAVPFVAGILAYSLAAIRDALSR